MISSRLTEMVWRLDEHESCIWEDYRDGAVDLRVSDQELWVAVEWFDFVGEGFQDLEGGYCTLHSRRVGGSHDLSRGVDFRERIKLDITGNLCIYQQLLFCYGRSSPRGKSVGGAFDLFEVFLVMTFVSDIL